MKKFRLLLVLMVVVIMSMYSCKHDDEVILPVKPVKVVVQITDTVALRKAVDSFPVLAINQFRALVDVQNSTSAPFLPTTKVSEILSELNLKNAKIEPNVYLLPLESWEYVITDQYVIRFSTYFEIDKDNKLVHEYTLSQKYYLVNGAVLDASSFEFDFEFGCPQAKQLFFSKSGVVSRLRYSCVLPNNKVIFYDDDEYEGTIYLAPIACGKWYVQGMVKNSGKTQSFGTGMIDLYNGSNQLPIVIQTYSPNVKYYVKLSKSLIKNAVWIYLIGHDNNGQYVWTKIPADIYNEQLPEMISLGSQFPIDHVQINDQNEYWNHDVRISPSSSVDGSEVIYELKN